MPVAERGATPLRRRRLARALVILTCAAAEAAPAEAQAEACPAVLPPETLLTQVFEDPPDMDAFEGRFLRDGLVPLRLGAPPGAPSATLVKEAGDLAGRYLQRWKWERNSMKPWEDPKGASVNPLNDTTLASPLRRAYLNYSQLAPADNTVQGPHQEGANPWRNNRRVIGFFCEEPADVDGGTGLFDMQKAWALLPPDLQQRLRRASWGLIAGGAFKTVPVVVKNDLTGAPCLQFYGFGRVAHDCVETYRAKFRKYRVREDPYTYSISEEDDLMLVPEKGAQQPFIGLDLYRLLNTIYDSMVVATWKRGDLLVVDNVRWAHARLEGSGLKRRVHFMHWGPRDNSFNLYKFGRL